jgi:RNA polymerase sigma factor (sigma-70 family)
MPPSESSDPYATNPSIFVRLNARDARPREIAWSDFQNRYGPIIARFARRFGARPHDVDDLVQDVMMGFFAKAPTFVYDPARGRFRGYLKVCTFRAACRRFGRDAKFNQTLPLSSLDENAIEVEQVWNDIWEKQRIERAMADVREQCRGEKTWQAFEQTVVQARSPQEVAEELGLSVSGVYKARDRVGKTLRERLRRLEQEEG